MRRLVGVALLALALASLGSVPVALLHASTVQGTASTISGLDDLAATADTQAKKGIGKVLAMVLGMGGLATVVAGRPGLGLSGLGAGLGMGFVPGMVSTAFDSAPAATLDVVQSATAGAWWAPMTLALYPLLLVLRVVQDPVFLACLALLVAVRLCVRSQGRPQTA